MLAFGEEDVAKRIQEEDERNPLVENMVSQLPSS
jgi:hypothetical protein